MKKVFWILFIVGLIGILGIFSFYQILPKMFPILPSKITEWVTEYTVISHLRNRTFPRILLKSLNNNPEVVTPNMYYSIATMYTFSQDGETFDTKDLILKVNKIELYCYNIPSYAEYGFTELDYTGYNIAEAIGEKWRCPKYL